MTKLSLTAYPHILGFEPLANLLERTAKSGTEGYPPYNIEQTTDRSFRISLAVAGFTACDLSVTLEDRQLVVRGRQIEDSAPRIFLHRGIGKRKFQRTFILAECVEVGEAVMENGLLHLDLTQSVPDTIVKTIAIKKGR